MPKCVAATSRANEPCCADAHWDADGAALLCECPRDRLADPPSGVGGQLIAFAAIELLDGADEAEIAFLNQVEQGQAITGVALGD
jgi:hypothetical protein